MRQTAQKRDTTQSLEKGGNQRQCNMDEEKLPECITVFKKQEEGLPMLMHCPFS